MNFWDTSALVPIIISEPSSKTLRSEFLAEEQFVVWWGTQVELVSAVARAARRKAISEAVQREALRKIPVLFEAAVLVHPAPPVARRAERLLLSHDLRCADALQLAAALTATEERTFGRGFYCLDKRLNTAAMREGFTILPGE